MGHLNSKEVNMEIIKKRLANLLSVKSLVTLTLTLVFAYMAVIGKISQDFMTIYAVIIAFYFGTQSQKTQQLMDNAEEKE
jgi:K+-transporting ATPase A subunit